MGSARTDPPRVPEICHAVARLDRAVNAAIARQVAPFGLTTLQYTILSVLQRHGTPLSNAQLARRMHMRPQSMAEVLEALEAKGLLKREAHPHHGRLMPARVMAKGRRILAACDKAVIDIEDKMFEAYSPARRQAFVTMARAALSTVRANYLTDESPIVLDEARRKQRTRPPQTAFRS